MSGARERGAAGGYQEENGLGWGGLVPTAAERRADAEEQRRRTELAQLRADREALLSALEDAAVALDLCAWEDGQMVNPGAEDAAKDARAAVAKVSRK